MIRFLQCDDFEYFDVTTHEYDVIELRDVIDDVINRRAMGISYGTRTPKSLSSEIFSMKVADRQIDRQTISR